MLEIKGKYTSAQIYALGLDDRSISQITELCNQSFVEDESIVIMPDAHTGSGCVIGYTQTIKNKKICPNLVGVDIGCSVSSYIISGVDSWEFRGVTDIIKSKVYSGHDVGNVDNTKPFRDRLRVDWRSALTQSGASDKQFMNCIGSLGTGNHFIEINKDDEIEGTYYLTIHSGSRFFGFLVAQEYQRLANVNNNGPKDLCYLEGDLADDYLHDMGIVMEVALENHRTMAKELCDGILNGRIGPNGNKYPVANGSVKIIDKPIFTTHNFIDTNDMIIRKGAVKAEVGKTCIIPMNMRDGSLLVEVIGKSDTWNNSLPHGAGRIMSRTQAKDKLSLNEFKNTMSNVYSPSISRKTIDESPMVYKSMDEITSILGEVKEYIKIKKIIKSVYNFKAN